MNKTEKIIKGIECCRDRIKDDLSQTNEPCDYCPYAENGNACSPWELFDDTLELLKEQESRILKPEEFAGTYSYCWLETKASDGRTTCGISDICVGDDGVNYEAQFIGTSDRGKLPRALLGSRWRCWSSEPTEEQRKAVKWE